MIHKAKKIMFNDGYVLDSNHIFFASQLQEYANDDRSRLSMLINNKWKYADFDDAVLSVTCLHGRNDLIFFMGHNGNILIGGLGKPIIEKISEIEKYGNILRIKNIAGNIFICGMTGQIYKRVNYGWVHLDKGILGKIDLDFEDIDGTGSDNLYAVGMHGFVFHYNGESWEQVDFPSNRPLSSIKCVSAEEIYVCGDDGNIFRGSYNNWEFIGEGKFDHIFWAIEKFGEKIYFSYDSGLLEYDGQRLSEVEFGIDGPIDCHRLHANDGVLWSFGIDNLLCFDGRKWIRVICPLNI